MAEEIEEDHEPDEKICLFSEWVNELNLLKEKNMDYLKISFISFFHNFLNLILVLRHNDFFSRSLWGKHSDSLRVFVFKS